MSEQQRRADLRADIRREIDTSSRLLVHTRSSVQKGIEQKQPVVALHPNHFTENTQYSAISKNSPLRTRGDSPSGKRSAAFMRNVYGNSVGTCIKQDPVNMVSRPTPASPHRIASPSRTDSHALVYGKQRRASSELPVPASVDNVESSLAGKIIRRSGDHHKNIIFPQEATGKVEKSNGRLWISKPLSNGDRHAQSKKLFDEKGTSIETRPETPTSGRRVLHQKQNLDGAGANVTSSPSRTNLRSRIDQFHTLQAPYRETDGPRAKVSAEGPRLNTGLMGLGASGKQKRTVDNSTDNLLDFQDKGWKGVHDIPLNRGPQLVAGKSHTSYQTINLAEHTAAEVNEKPFRPSTVVMNGPPSFVPEPMRRRASPSARKFDNAQFNSDIHNNAPVAATRIESPVRRGRSPGKFSPLRQSSIY
jgi:hypothetical protein